MQRSPTIREERRVKSNSFTRIRRVTYLNDSKEDDETEGDCGPGRSVFRKVKGIS